MNEKFFSYDNLSGDYLSLKNDIRLGTPTAVFGVNDTQKYITASLNEVPVLYLCPDAVSANKAYASISVLSGKKVALLTAKDEVLTYKEALSKDSLFKRINGLYAIQSGAKIIVADVESVMQLAPSFIPSVGFKVDLEYPYQDLPQILIKMGYVREYSVESKGSFAVRGDVLDIYPVNAENPVRIDFFGDVIECIRPYDAITGERLDTVQEITVIAATDCFYDENDVKRCVSDIYALLKKCPDEKSYRRSSEIYDGLCTKMQNSSSFVGAAFVMPLLKNTRTVFDLLQKNTLVIYDECKSVGDNLSAIYKEHLQRYADLKIGGEVFEFSKNQILLPETVIERLLDYQGLVLQTFTASTAFFRPLRTYNFHSTPSPSYHSSTNSLINDVKNWLQCGYRVLIFTGSLQRYERMKGTLIDEGIGVEPLPRSLDVMRGVCLFGEELDNGIILHECKVAIIGSGNVYTKTAPKRIRKKRGDMFTAPEVGDYAVHEKHGIGKILGTKKIETTDGIKEYISIAYKGGDMLYVPVEQMDILSKYMGGGTPTLSKIGGADFERVKERVKASIKKLAFDLKKLYALREGKNGYKFPENAVMMEEFENAFKYEETPDQLSSIAEIKADMCSEKVMDRLLCGDVGYGKTEVALRAVYLCVLGGKQAAIMCPGTILSEQHFNTAIERFADFGVRVEKLNRFKTPKQQAETLNRLREGKIDLIIGTHRLLSDDVQFYDLGLLVLDEEQRFGVEHKEKIKNIKNNIDCLTMTATPIPRTLHMSLAGIRDISTIATPPQKRLPVQTYVVEETETLIRDAVLRELSRGGQVFILYNRVESISSFAGRICEIVPEAKVCYAHGRMDKTLLENNVFSFYRGENNVLVTTTIIENGIDLPNANTIIVIDSDRLGISQLYQLRGRVGRGSRLAQAYFTFKGTKVMTSDATERLKAIMQFTELGSGFKIAMRDLEIRGAGNVLGAEQHGHMDKVGYELYSKLLKEELTGENQFSAELDIKLSAYIPEWYIENNSVRLDSYKQIAEIRSIADYKRVCLSIEDNFGQMPNEVLNLLLIAVLKAYATTFNIKKIIIDENGGVLVLPGLTSLKDARLSAALDKYSNYTTLAVAKDMQIVFKPHSTLAKTLLEMTKFLKFALSFT